VLEGIELISNGTQALQLTGNALSPLLIDGDLSHIVYVDLSRNNIKLHQLEQLEVLIGRIPMLRALDLSNNNLDSVSQELLQGSGQLEYLDISNNEIFYIAKRSFSALHKLTTLKLNDNRLRSVNSEWFTGLRQLKSIDLSSNGVTALEAECFSALPRLETVNLDNNTISVIDNQAFRESPIVELYLSKNQLVTFPTKAFAGLTRLVILRLNDNPIRGLTAGTVTGLTSLREISLNNMAQFRIIDTDAFLNLSKLRKVEAFMNKALVYVSPLAFTNCTEIVMLHLHNNNLRGVEESLINTLPKLAELSVYNNPLHCGATISWLVELNSRANFSLVDGSHTTCRTPSRGMTLAELGERLPDTPVVVPLFQPMSTINAEFGTELTLECRAIGAAAISWLTSAENDTAIVSAAETLRIGDLRHDNQGLYTCVATSQSGKTDSETVIINVVHSVIVLSTLAVSKDFILLSWNLTAGESVISYRAGNSMTAEVTVPDGQSVYTLTDLLPDTTHTICLLYHRREERNCINTRTLPLSRRDMPGWSVTGTGGHSTVQSILIALVITSSLVIIGVILSLVYKRCQRYKKAKVLYTRQRDDSSVEPIVESAFTEKCYNPTTVPLRDAEMA